MVGVLVLNADFTVLGSTNWQKAIKLIVLEKAEIHEADPEREVRGATHFVPFPRVIRLKQWIYVKFSGRNRGAAMCTKKGVLERDKFTCGYCGAKANTVDHVMPESRGGKSSWENLISACEPCNGFKADRTPEEARMYLKWHPYRPDVLGAQQRKVWMSL